MGDSVSDRALRDDTSSAHHDDPVGGHCHLAHQVAGDEDRFALPRRERSSQFADPVHPVGVEFRSPAHRARASSGSPRSEAAMPSL